MPLDALRTPLGVSEALIGPPAVPTPPAPESVRLFVTIGGFAPPLPPPPARMTRNSDDSLDGCRIEPPLVAVTFVSPSGLVSVPSRKMFEFELMSMRPREWPPKTMWTGLSARTDIVIVRRASPGSMNVRSHALFCSPSKLQLVYSL